MSPAETASTMPPAEPGIVVDPAAAAMRARDEQIAIGNMQAGNALYMLAEAYVENEALRRALAAAQTTERQECIALVERLASEFRRGSESDWEYGALESASVLRGRR